MALGISNFEQLPWYIQVALEDMEQQLQTTLFNTGLTNVTVATVNDKTGYSLTAGSYSVRASSTQRGTVSLAGVTTDTATVTAVTLIRATEAFCGQVVSEDVIHQTDTRIALTNTTTLRGTKNTATGTTVAGFTVTEFF